MGNKNSQNTNSIQTQNTNGLMPNTNLGSFCGTSTKDTCSSSADCIAGGCSRQICGSAKNGGLISTCEWKDCYANKDAYKCDCINQQCQWRSR